MADLQLHRAAPIARRRGLDVGTVTILTTTTVSAAERLETWLAGLKLTTRRAYQLDLAHFARFVGKQQAGDALAVMIVLDRARAVQSLEQYRTRQVEAGLSSAVINRRLAAINTALRELGRVGIGPGKLDVANVKPERRTRTEGAPIHDIGLAIRALECSSTHMAIRDVAILRLAAQVGLRRREIAALGLADFDAAAGTVAVIEKGKAEQTRKRVPPRVVAALERWLAVRPRFAAKDEAAVFVTLRGDDTGRSMPAAAVYETCHRAAEIVIGEKPRRPAKGASAAEIETHNAALAAWTLKARPFRPHGFRHTAATAGYRATRDVAAVKAFLGHANVQTTVAHYLDESEEMAARVTDVLADMV